MRTLESFTNFNIVKPADHKEKMNLRRQAIQGIRDYFAEFEDRGDYIAVAKSSSYSGYNHKGFELHAYYIEIVSDFDILPSVNMKRLQSKFEIIDIQEVKAGNRKRVVIKIRDKG